MESGRLFDRDPARCEPALSVLPLRDPSAARHDLDANSGDAGPALRPRSDACPSVRPMPAAALHEAFPVLGHTAYLNAGSCGPYAAATLRAMTEEVTSAGRLGRGLPYYERLTGFKGRARSAWARLLGAPETEIALTAGASDGIARVLGLVDWSAGDEIVTSDEEHPGVLGPLGALVRRHGVKVTVAPWAELADRVSPATSLVVVSHVSWLRGRVADLSAIGAAGAPVLVDGAQSAGAIAVDAAELRRLGVIGYAAAGQKWTCGPVGTGALWLDPGWAPDEGVGVWPTYDNLADPASGLDAAPWPDARRLDAASLSCEVLAGSVAALGVLEQAGWANVQERATRGPRGGGVARGLGPRRRRARVRRPSSPGDRTMLPPRSHGPWRPASSFVGFLDSRGCAPRSARGRPTRTSSGSWPWRAPRRVAGQSSPWRWGGRATGSAPRGMR